MRRVDRARFEQLVNESREFVREVIGENEKVVQDLLQRSVEQTSRLEVVLERLDELAEESKAHSQAIFILIDHLRQLGE